MVTTQTLTDLDKSAQTGVFEDDISYGSLVCIVSIKDSDSKGEAKPYEVFQDIKSSLITKAPEESNLKVLKRAYLSIREDYIQIVAALFVNKNIFVLCSNGAGAFVAREDRLVPLIKTSKSEYLTVSGKTHNEDVYLFATHEVIANLPLDTIQLTLKQAEIENFSPLLETVEEEKALAISKIDSKEGISNIVPTKIKSSQSGHAANKNSEISPVKKKLVGVLDKIISLIPQRSIRVQENEYAFKQKRKGRSASLAGIVLLLILGVSIYFGLKADKVQQRKDEYQPRIAEARHNLEEARQIFELSPPRAQELILSAQMITDSLKSEGVEDEELDQLISEIRNNLGPIAGIYKSEPTLFLDLSLISSGFSSQKLAFSTQAIRVLDTNEKKLSGVEIESKRTEIISGPDFLPDAIDVIAYDSRSFVLSSDGIREVTDEVDLTIKSDWDANNILVKAFAGNMYVLEKQANQIWRYSGVRGGFLEKTAWLGEGIEPDFSNASAVSIDGEIWVLSFDGDIDRYSASVPLNFFVEGLTSDLSGASDLFTDENSDYLYILDTKNNRVVFITKDGQYGGEYTSDLLADALEIVVSEETNQIIFLADSKLYSIELNHLN